MSAETMKVFYAAAIASAVIFSEASAQEEEFQAKLLAAWDSQLQQISEPGCVLMQVQERTVDVQKNREMTVDAYLQNAPAIKHKYCFLHDRACLYFDQPNGRVLIHINNPKYFAAVEADGRADGDVVNASVVRSYVKMPAPSNDESVEAALARSTSEQALAMRMPSANLAGRNLHTLIENGLLKITSVDPNVGEDRTAIVLDVIAPNVFEPTALRHVKRFRMTLINSMGFAPESAESLELSDGDTSSVRLLWRHRRNASGKVVPAMQGSVWELTSGKALAYRSDQIELDLNPGLQQQDFTLSAFNLPEPLEPKIPGSYRTQPWLYYFVGGVLCVGVGAFFVHRATRARSAA